MSINIKYNSGGLVFQEDEPSLSECRDVLRTAETLANGLNAQGRRAFGMAKHKQHQPFSTAIIVRNLHQQQIQLWRVNIFLEWNYIVKKSKIIAHN